jgi:hypothetical protein
MLLNILYLKCVVKKSIMSLKYVVFACETCRDITTYCKVFLSSVTIFSMKERIRVFSNHKITITVPQIQPF